MHRLKGAGLIASAVLICGCDTQARSAALEEQNKNIAELRSEIETLRSELSEIEKEQNILEFKELFRDLDQSAFLRPGDAGYSPVRFDLGTLTVQIEDVKAYANGSKVTLRFGNPLATSIGGLKLKIDWGRTDQTGAPDNGSAKSKEFNFVETLRSGAWTTVSVVLDGVPPAELGFVRVKEVRHTSISLNK